MENEWGGSTVNFEPLSLNFDRSHTDVFCNNTVIYTVSNTTYIGNAILKTRRHVSAH